MRLSLALLATAGLLLCCTATIASQRNFLSTPLTHEDGNVIREVGYIPLSDGTKLSYVAYHPVSPKRVPVIVEYSPYGVGGTPFGGVWGPSPKDFIAHGYAYVGVDIRGTTCSTGSLTMMDPQVGRDGAQMIDYIGSRTWSNGSVGMWGISYPGHNQFFTAANHPRYLKALAAGGLTADVYAEAWRPGGMFSSSFIAHWAIAIQGMGFVMSDYGAARSRNAWGDTTCDPDKAKHSFWSAYDQVRDHPLDDAWWKPRLLESYVGKIQVPTLIFGGWQDFETKSSGAVYLYGHLQVKNKRIVLEPGGHGIAAREFSQAEAFRWYDHWLKHVNNGVDREPPVKVYWDVRPVNGVQTPKWSSDYPTWPVPDVTPVTLYLNSSGELSPQEPSAGKDNEGRLYVTPFGTEMVADNQQFALAPDPQGSLLYRTAPLQSDMTLLGFTQLDLFFSSTERDTDIMVVLHDVDQRGNVTYIQRDYLQASLRKIDPALSTPEEQKRCFCEVQKLVPGKIYEARLSIPPVGYIVRKGHRLELGIMTPSQIGTPDWGFVLVDQGGLNTVYSSPLHPSKLVLSTIKSPTVLPPPPACGELEWQPCRKPPQNVAP
jgi:uncharacterized protein